MSLRCKSDFVLVERSAGGAGCQQHSKVHERELEAISCLALLCVCQDMPLAQVCEVLSDRLLWVHTTLSRIVMTHPCLFQGNV